MVERTFSALAILASLMLFTAGLMPAQDSGRKLDEQVKQLQERAEKMAAEIEARFSGPEWQAKIKQIEEAAARIDTRVNSPEWQEQVRQLEGMSKKIDAELKAKFEGPEWQEHIRRISEMAANAASSHGRAVEQSADCKKEMQQLHEATRQIQEEVRRYFDSPEWKEQLRQLREAARKLREDR